MAYKPINSSEVLSGEPVSSPLMSKVKDNFADHEERITGIETGTVVNYPPIIMRVNGPYADLGSANWTGVLKTTSNFALRITGVRLIIDRAGTTGATSINLLKSSGGGTYTSVLTTQPVVPAAAGNDAVSSGLNGTTAAVVNPTQETLSAGDYLRLDITSSQSGTTINNAPLNFLVRIDFEKV